jgi:CoA:oxalate CoA-transferase
MAHPHLRTRGTVRRVSDRDIGAFDIPGLAAKFSRWAPTAEIKADRLGEHNEEILRNLLGLRDAEIQQLYCDKTIVHDPLLEGQAEKSGKNPDKVRMPAID